MAQPLFKTYGRVLSFKAEQKRIRTVASNAVTIREKRKKRLQREGLFIAAIM